MIVTTSPFPLPVPALEECRFDGSEADWTADHLGHLMVCVQEGRGQRGHVDWVADRLVARRIDDVSQGLGKGGKR